MLKTLAGYIKQYKRDTILAPVFTVLEVILEILIPFVIAMLIDEGINAGNMERIVFYGVIMLVLAFLSLASGVLAGKYAASASTGFACNLREAQYANIQRFSFSNIDKFSTSGLITRMTTDITNIQNAFMMIIRIAIRAPIMMICSIFMCFVINRTLALVFLVVLAFLAIALFTILGRATPIFNDVFSKYDDLNANVQENIAGIRVVKAFVREDFEDKKFSKASDTLYKLFVKAESILVLNNPVMMFVIYAAIIALSWFGAQFIVIGDMTTGNLTSMFTYVMQMMMSLMILSMVFVMISMSTASARRIAEVLSEQPDMTAPEAPVTKVADGSIDFDHVNFSYMNGSGEDVLHDINLHINSGETIGIIGGTGCGKSSLVSLISRLYDVDSGTVMVGGVDVRRYDMTVIRDSVAVVLQKNVLFSGTILDNLRWGKEDATLEECKEVCAQACADDFIEGFPDKYDTWIDQGGTNVSGGQKQRLCIARALLKRPKVLILDDSTSAVDTATDARIRKAFATKIPGTTKLIISQRVSSVQDADRILVLDEGRINGFDTHENLLEQNEIYRDIYEVQMKSGGDFDEKAG